MKARWINIPVGALIIISVGQTPDKEALAGEALAKRSGCFECHSVDKRVVGPAYREVAARYKDDAGARDALIEKVKKGGKENWIDVTGGVPMPPHGRRLSNDDIERLVDWVLGLQE